MLFDGVGTPSGTCIQRAFSNPRRLELINAADPLGISGGLGKHQIQVAGAMGVSTLLIIPQQSRRF